MHKLRVALVTRVQSETCQASLFEAPRIFGVDRIASQFPHFRLLRWILNFVYFLEAVKISLTTEAQSEPARLLVGVAKAEIVPRILHRVSFFD